jgi:hypothetical protein
MPRLPQLWISCNQAESLIFLGNFGRGSGMAGIAVDLQKMTVPDKLRLMEALWNDLSRSEELASPDWHGEVLAERDRLVESGEESFIDWKIAKRQLREELQ